MSKANDPAFPNAKINTFQSEATETIMGDGLTKREYFAAMAMQGLLASDVINDYKTSGMGVEQIIGLAIEHADALLAELDKK